MGSAGVRAVSLCDSNLVDLVGRFFVPLVVEYNFRMAPLMPARGTMGKRLQNALTEHFRTSNVLLETYVLDSEGRFLDIAKPMGPTNDVMLEQARVAILRYGLDPGPPVASYHSTSHVPEAAVQLRAVVRYTDPNPLPVLQALSPLTTIPGYGLHPPALLAGTRDWITLTEAQSQKLTPSGPVHEGSTFDVADDVARTVLSHLRPDPSLMEADSDERAIHRVQAASLQGTVIAASGDTARATLRGALDMFHPGFRPENVANAPSDKNRLTYSIVGYMEWNVRTHAITKISITTQDGCYASPDGAHRIGVEACAYLVPIEKESQGQGQGEGHGSTPGGRR